MLKEDSIYLDYAASTPVLEEVINEMLPYFTIYYGNPSNSNNAMGTIATNAVNKAKNQITNALNADEYQIVFTSGATESINTCLKSIYSQRSNNKNQIITCRTEHKAVLDTCEYLESIGAEITFLDVDSNGNISYEELENNITDRTLAVALMTVNNETGVIHDIVQISEICLKHKVSFVCDATQAVGKIPIDLNQTPIDYLIFSGHKVYAPKGIGVLLVKKGVSIKPLIHGGGQQNNLRSGTLNVPAIVGLGKAIELLANKLDHEFNRIKEIQLFFEKELLNSRKFEIIGKNTNRSPFISNVCLKNNSIEDIIFPLSEKVFFSTASACSSHIMQASHVILSMGYSNHKADNCLRFSYGAKTSNENILKTITMLKSIL